MSKHSQHNQPNQIVRHEQASFAYAGPIPHPNDLARYEQILPGAAERIMAMAEKQADHRRALEMQVVSSGVRKSERGLIFGLIIGITAIVVGGACAVLGKEIAASFIGGGGLIGLVSVFVIGSQQQKNERLQKEKMMQEQQ
jgi:uncharacterized membrane protein